jgi:predicted small secreted protein
MRRLLIALLAVLLAVPLAGCGNDKDRGINKDRDKPRAPASDKPG